MNHITLYRAGKEGIEAYKWDGALKPLQISPNHIGAVLWPDESTGAKEKKYITNKNIRFYKPFMVGNGRNRAIYGRDREEVIKAWQEFKMQKGE